MTFSFPLDTQGFGFEEAHLPEDSVLWPFWKKRVPVGGSQEARVLDRAGGLGVAQPSLPGPQPSAPADLLLAALGVPPHTPPPRESQAPLVWPYPAVLVNGGRQVAPWR